MLTTASVQRKAPQDLSKIIAIVRIRLSHGPLRYDWIDVVQKNDIHMNVEPKEPLSTKQQVKGSCAAGSYVITRLNAALSLSMVLNVQPVPEVCCRLQGPMKEYRLFVIGSVTTECTQQQMRN